MLRNYLTVASRSLLFLLSKEFIILVIIASAFALPAGWWVMNKWLSEFAYRIDIDWVTFTVSALSSVVIAWIALSFQTIKAAAANPVNSLRNE